MIVNKSKFIEQLPNLALTVSLVVLAVVAYLKTNVSQPTAQVPNTLSSGLPLRDAAVQSARNQGSNDYAFEGGLPAGVGSSQPPAKDGHE